MSNSFGTLYRLTSFGESHGAAIGGIIDGCPAGIRIDLQAIARQLARRKPGQSDLTTSRSESDSAEFLSGIFEGRTLGTPIGFIVRNENARSADYDNMRGVFRPSHADYTYTAKYGHRDHRGGGRSSARVTIPQVVYGALAMQILETRGITVRAYTSAIGSMSMGEGYHKPTLAEVDSNDVRCPDAAFAKRLRKIIEEAKGTGDSVGGVVSCVVSGVPAGLGEPVFDKLNARLAAAMMGINAAKGFEIGAGFAGCTRHGSELTDNFYIDPENGAIRCHANNSGGIQGGISNGEDINFRVAFKPVATLLRDVATIDDAGREVTLHAKGRHDPCVVPRAVPIVESMAAAVILDFLLLNSASRF